MARTQIDLKRPDPAYRLFTSDFLVRNIDLSDEQVGRFIRLLCLQHQNGHLTEATLLAYCKGRDELVFSRFLQDEKGLYYNEEMENEKIRRAEVSRKKSENANKRWQDKNITGDPGKPKPERMDTHIPEYDD